MLDQTMIDQYLQDVDSYLHVDRPHRDRVLAEIGGHLHDAVDAHLAQGLQPQEAMRQAIAEMGPAQDVATQFSSPPPPTRSIRGWRRWTPIVLPSAVLATGTALTLWNLLYLLRNGPTRGGELALRYSLLYAGVAGALTAATSVAIRKGDCDPAWRRAAWGCSTLTVVILAVSYVF